MKFLVLAAILSNLSTYAQSSRTQTNHPDGFTVQHPQGWQIDTIGRRIVVFANATEFVSIEPVPNPKGLPAPQLLQALEQSGHLGPLNKPAVSRPRSADATSVAAILILGNQKAHLLLSARGPVATLMIAAAPAATFSQRLPELVQILQSFRFTPPAQQSRAQTNQTQSLKYKTLTDPREQAYSLEAPADWQSELGMYRPTVGDFRAETSTRSPDGSMLAFLGDRNIGRFIVPNPAMAQYGVREGGTYNPSGSVIYSVLRYLPGQQFASFFLNRRFPGARITGQQDLPQLNAQLSAARYRYRNPNNSKMGSGQIEFEYQGKIGYVCVTTEVFGGTMGMYFWNVVNLVGYLAAPASTSTAVQVSQHLLQSARANPQWVMREYRMQEIEAKQGMDSLHATNDLWAQTLGARSESNAYKSRLAGDNLSGQFRMQDPGTGQQVNVQATSNFFYRVNNTDTVIGTNQPLGANTPIDVTRLLRIDVDPRP